MNDTGTFIYRKHTVDYKIGSPMGHTVNDWRIPVLIRLDNKHWDRCIGMIPVRLPEIKRMVRQILAQIKG